MFDFITKIKLAKKYSENIKLKRRIRKITGFTPRDIFLYKTSLIHKSVEKAVDVNNERLEFLGDAILDAIVADFLFRTFKDKDEGFLTKQKSNIVKRKKMNDIATKIEIAKLVSYKILNTNHKHVFGNALEAFIGAVYLDRGYEKTRQFIESRIIKPFVNIEQIDKEDIDFKSRIIEWGQKNKKETTFDTYEKYTDMEKTPTFASYVLINGEKIGEGEGKSKKEAEQIASEKALDQISFIQEKTD